MGNFEKKMGGMETDSKILKVALEDLIEGIQNVPMRGTHAGIPIARSKAERVIEMCFQFCNRYRPSTKEE